MILIFMLDSLYRTREKFYIKQVSVKCRHDGDSNELDDILRKWK
jgi:hypothetical protein